jgi:hypothetical protein
VNPPFNRAGLVEVQPSTAFRTSSENAASGLHEG